MQNKFKKILIFTPIIVFILLSIAFYFLYKSIQIKNTNAEKVLSEWKIEDSRRTEIKNIMKSVQVIEQDNILIQSHFAKGSDVVPFLDNIDSFAPKVNSEDEVISVEITKEKQELIVGINVLGSFESVYHYLTLLENSPYEIEFTGVDIQTNDKGFKSDKTDKIYNWEGMFKIKLLSFIP
jgi:hypothetical protein